MSDEIKDVEMTVESNGMFCSWNALCHPDEPFATW